MNLSESDKALFKEIVREVSKEVLEQHINNCPYGKKIIASMWLIAGIGIGSGLASGGLVLAIAKVFIG